GRSARAGSCTALLSTLAAARLPRADAAPGPRVAAVVPPRRVAAPADARVFHAAQDVVRDEVAARPRDRRPARPGTVIRPRSASVPVPFPSGGPHGAVRPSGRRAPHHPARRALRDPLRPAPHPRAGSRGLG